MAALTREPLPSASGADAVLETAHEFGAGLVGVLTRPATGASGKAALILYNAGLVQRCGPYRIQVKLARELARRGFVVLRFDQGGLGDSAASRLVDPVRKRSEATAAAMELVTRQTGLDRFVLGGICSGADDALNIGPDDPRVDGLMLLDGAAYHTRGYRLRRYLPRLFRPSAVMHGFGRLLRRRAPVEARTIDADDYRHFPDRAETTRRLHALVGRGAHVLLLYTGGNIRYYNHRRQARECFGAVVDSPRWTDLYWEDCDHTFYLREHRERLLRTLGEWMQSRYSA